MSPRGGSRSRNRKASAAHSFGPHADVRVVEVAAGLVFRDNRVLITRRREDSHLGGFWEFPGGKREGRETFEQCLERELEEELGIRVTVGQILESLTHAYPAKTVHLKFFKCRCNSGEPRALGCSAFAWVSPEELKNYRFPAADARLIRVLQETPDLWRGY